MPVGFDKFDSIDQEDDWPIRQGTNTHRIVSFLIEHQGTGITPSEIAEATDVPRGSVGPVLHRLNVRGVVRHTEPYWAGPSDKPLVSLEGMLIGLDALDCSDGNDGWAAVDRTDYEVSEDEPAAWRADQ